jgi:hypothetical protein
MVARPARGAKNAPRGPAATRRDRTKADRDGDLTMDGPARGRGGRVGKSSGSGSARKDLTAGKGKGGILSTANQRAILKHAGAGDVAMKGSKSVPSRGLTELKVTNWNKSKASTSPDGGVSSLITWLKSQNRQDQEGMSLTSQLLLFWFSPYTSPICLLRFALVCKQSYQDGRVTNLRITVTRRLNDRMWLKSWLYSY